jgi:hypothetical protein
MYKNKSTENNLKTAFPSRLSTFRSRETSQNPHFPRQTYIFWIRGQSCACFLFLINVLGFYTDLLEFLLVDTTMANFCDLFLKNTFHQHFDLKFSWNVVLCTAITMVSIELETKACEYVLIKVSFSEFLSFFAILINLWSSTKTINIWYFQLKFDPWVVQYVGNEIL